MEIEKGETRVEGDDHAEGVLKGWRLQRAFAEGEGPVLHQKRHMTIMMRDETSSSTV